MMDLLEYVRIVRRGWPTLVFVLLLSVSVAALYLLAAPKRYEASATLLVTVDSSGSAGEIASGVTAATSAASTIAGVIDSTAVLGPAGERLDPAIAADAAAGMVVATQRDATALIDVTAAGGDPRTVADLANAAAQVATTAIPRIEDGPGLVITQQATRPSEAISPNPRQVIGLGVIVGVVLGIAAAIALQTLDSRLRRPEDVQRSGRRVLAALPRLSRHQRQGIVVADHSNSAAAEAYRALRANLGSLESSGRRSLLVAPVSSDRSPGLVAANLAWSIAQTGRAVLLIDVDIRRAPLDAMLGLASGPGLSDVLGAKRASTELAVRRTRHERVDVVTAGTAHGAPSDLLSQPRFGQFLREWELHYDFVVLSAPGLLERTDAAVVARVAGSTLVLVSSGRTRAPDLDAAYGMLQNVGVSPLGVVLAETRNGAASDNRRLRSRPVSRERSRGDGDVWTASEQVAVPVETTRPSR